MINVHHKKDFVKGVVTLPIKKEKKKGKRKKEKKKRKEVFLAKRVWRTHVFKQR